MSKKPGMHSFVHRQQAGAASPTAPATQPNTSNERVKRGDAARLPVRGGFGLPFGLPTAQAGLSFAPDRPAPENIATTTTPARPAPSRDRYDSDLSESVTTQSRPRSAGHTRRREASIVISSDRSSDSEDEHDHESDEGNRRDGYADYDNPIDRATRRPYEGSQNQFDKYLGSADSQKALEKLEQLKRRQSQCSVLGSYPTTTSGVESETEQVKNVSTKHGQHPGQPPQPQNKVPDNCKQDYMSRSVMNYNKQHAPLSNALHEQPSTHAGTGYLQTHVEPVVTRSAPASPAGLDQQSALLPPGRAAVLGDSAAIAVSSLNGAALDYSTSVLFKKPFGDLRSESFDLDPSAQIGDAANDHNPTAIRNLLHVYITYDAKKQSQHCSAIPQSQWPEVDAWFAQEFREMAKQRRQKREERRNIARRFEGEVAKRYDAVDAEKKGIETALKDMKQRGGAIVEGLTPKRKRSGVA